MAKPNMTSSWARATGLAYLLYFLAAIAGQILVSKHAALPGKTINFISVALYILLGILFGRLFWPSGKILSCIAVLFNFAGGAMTLLALQSGNDAPANPLLFFGVYCLLLGVLILRSTFLPSVLGLLLLAAGIGWLVFLGPWHTRFLVISIEVLGFLSEAALMLWLLCAGVNELRWVDQASEP
jgi:ABC-type antimicrobial peptide transport system permease subunit